MTAVTELIQIEDAIDQLSEAALECRDFSHSWRSYRAWEESWGFTRILKCRNCGSEREDQLDRRGGLIENGRHYKYADGYLVAGIGRLSGERKDAVRLESVLRSLPKKPRLKKVEDV